MYVYCSTNHAWKLNIIYEINDHKVLQYEDEVK